MAFKPQGKRCRLIHFFRLVQVKSSFFVRHGEGPLVADGLAIKLRFVWKNNSDKNDDFRRRHNLMEIMGRTDFDLAKLFNFAAEVSKGYLRFFPP